jgi:hypothetical protein
MMKKIKKSTIPQTSTGAEAVCSCDEEKPTYALLSGIAMVSG